MAEKIIRDLLAGHRLPTWAASFISNNWTKLLHISLLKEKNNEQAVEPVKQKLRDLIWSLSVKEGEELKSSFTTRVLPLYDEISHCFASIVTHPGAVDDFLKRLESFHVQILNGVIPVCDWLSFPGLSYDMEPNHDHEIAKLEEIGLLKCGCWVEYFNGKNTMFCRVAHRDIKLQLIILVNYTGVKVASLPFSDVKKLFDEQKLKLVTFKPVLEDVVVYTIKFIHSEIHRLKLDIEKKNKEAVKQNVLNRLKKSREERLQALIERKRGEKRAAKLQQEQNKKKQIQQFQEQVESLSMGAVFCIKNASGDEVNARLALKMRTSGKLLFVDSSGIKIKELLPQEVAIELYQGTMTLLNDAKKNSSTLESLVAHQRNVLNKR